MMITIRPIGVYTYMQYDLGLHRSLATDHLRMVLKGLEESTCLKACRASCSCGGLGTVQSLFKESLSVLSVHALLM